jgi:hypothetical protein
MSSYSHRIDLPAHGKVDIQIHNKGKEMISNSQAKRIVNRERVQKMGLLIITGKPQLLIDQARGILCWQVPFLVQPPRDDKKAYPIGEYACVDAYSGEYVLDEKSIHKIRKAAWPIIKKLYPDMEDYLHELDEIRRKL